MVLSAFFLGQFTEIPSCLLKTIRMLNIVMGLVAWNIIGKNRNGQAERTKLSFSIRTTKNVSIVMRTELTEIALLVKKWVSNLFAVSWMVNIPMFLKCWNMTKKEMETWKIGLSKPFI